MPPAMRGESTSRTNQKLSRPRNHPYADGHVAMKMPARRQRTTLKPPARPSPLVVKIRQHTRVLLLPSELSHILLRRRKGVCSRVIFKPQKSSCPPKDLPMLLAQLLLPLTSCRRYTTLHTCPSYALRSRSALLLTSAPYAGGRRWTIKKASSHRCG